MPERSEQRSSRLRDRHGSTARHRKHHSRALARAMGPAEAQPGRPMHHSRTLARANGPVQKHCLAAGCITRERSLGLVDRRLL